MPCGVLQARHALPGLAASFARLIGHRSQQEHPLGRVYCEPWGLSTSITSAPPMANAPQRQGARATEPREARRAAAAGAPISFGTHRRAATSRAASRSSSDTPAVKALYVTCLGNKVEHASWGAAEASPSAERSSAAARRSARSTAGALRALMRGRFVCVICVCVCWNVSVCICASRCV